MRNKLITGVYDNPGYAINPFLGLCPVACVIDDIANGREVSLIITRPELRAEEDVFELCAVGDLQQLLDKIMLIS